jgi:hypothetical protein
MTKARRIGLALMLLCGGISIWWGAVLVRVVPGGPLDFQHIYYGTRCLLQHHNPYIESELEGVYRAEGGERPSQSIQARRTVTLYRNLPTTLLLIVPFAMLPLGVAQALWMILTGAGLILAAYLMWNLGASYAPILSGCLIAILLSSCEFVFTTGNSAGIVVGLCVVAVWCFLEERFVSAGILCLAVSLAVKPHDAGLVWLYFLLAGGVCRKRALQTLAVTAVLGVASILWISHVAPHWTRELNSNMLLTSTRGDLNDPGPASVAGRTPGMIIDLQTVISVFRDDPRIYNPVSYLVCGALLIVWFVRTLRSRFSQRGALLALAAVVPLTLLVTYHRSYDAKLLLLAVPACAMLWAEGGPIRWIALVVTTAGVALTADIPLAILVNLVGDTPLGIGGIFAQTRSVVLMRPTPLILLVMSIFYLWMYLRNAGYDRKRGMAETFSPGSELAVKPE